MFLATFKTFQFTLLTIIALAVYVKRYQEKYIYFLSGIFIKAWDSAAAGLKLGYGCS